MNFIKQKGVFILTHANIFKRFSNLLMLFIFFIESALLLIILQYMQIGSFSESFNWVFMHKKIYLLSTIMLTLFAWGLISLINKFWISNSLFVDLIIIFGFVNSQKIQFRQEPLLPSDLTMISNANQLSSMISITNIMVLIFICIIIFILNYMLGKHFAIQQNAFKIPFRILGCSLACLMLFSFFYINHENSMSAKIGH